MFIVCYNLFIDNCIIKENLDFGGGVVKDIYVCKGFEVYFWLFYFVNWRNLYLLRGVWEFYLFIIWIDVKEIIRKWVNMNVKFRWVKMDKIILRYVDID